MSNLNICYVCNGCGIYSSYGDKPFNKINIDLTNHVAFSTGFIMKNPTQDLLFCNECFSKVIDGEIKIRSFGSTSSMIEKISTLEAELKEVESSFSAYKSKVSSLIQKELK